jgi:hypothetical protein
MAKRLALITLLISFVLPMIAFAQISSCVLGRNISYGGIRYTKDITVYDPDIAPATVSTCTAPIATTSCYHEDWGSVCLMNSIYNVTDWISYILIAIAAIMIIVGALTLATAAGAPEKVTAGKNYILFAIIGLVVALLSRAIPAIARRFVG